MVLGVSGAHPLLEEGKLCLRSSVLHHVLENRGVKGVEHPLNKVARRPAHERLLPPPRVLAHMRKMRAFSTAC